MTRLFLFDIDLTLIRTSGAGAAAMTEAFASMLGVPDAFAGVTFAGRTDRAILREVLARHGHDGDPEGFVAAFRERYLPCLERQLRQRGGEVLPGVRETLSAVAALPGARLGLATGNFRAAAEIKLRHFDLWAPFADGGFAEDGEDRRDVVAAAIRRLTGRDGADAVVVLGDTPDDISAAKANGAVAIGVATGFTGAALLAASGADLVLDDLSDPALMLRLLADRVTGLP